MKHIIETMGETVTELAGALVVLVCLGAAFGLFRNLGDIFISYFI